MAEAHLNLGGILKNNDKLKEAELSIRKAIEIKPDLAQAYSNLGIILNELEQYLFNKGPVLNYIGSSTNIGNTELVANNWYHIVISAPLSVNSVVNKSYIGHNNKDSTTILFQGQMSDFRVYDCQLSKSEVHKLYNYSNIYKSISY